MKHKSIEATVDAYPGLTPYQRMILFNLERMKGKINIILPTKKQNDDKTHTNGAA